MRLLFAIQSYAYLQEELLKHTDFKRGNLTVETFPDGEIYHRINENIKDEIVTLIGGSINDNSTLELFDLAMGMIHLGARELQIVIPFYGYATMERAVKSGEVVKAKTRANLFSALTGSSTKIRIYLMDLHSEGIPYYFNPNMFTKHIYGKKFVMDACKSLAGDHFVIAATDAGRAKWVESLALEMHVNSAFIYKQRDSATHSHITGVNAEVENQTVIIYDDMIRTGGSLMNAAEAYHQKGASHIFAITTHGMFNNHALEKIEKQGLIKKVISSNSHPAALSQKSELLEIKSIADIIFESL